jgi:hypothetical protein
MKGGSANSTAKPAKIRLLLTREPEPSALVLNEPRCYHFRVLDPRGFAILPATLAAVTIGRCYHI